MALRKASSYSKRNFRPYTRKSKTKSKSYIKTVPPQKIVKFKMGNIADFNHGKFRHIVRLVAAETVLIRDNSLEASRQHILKHLDTELPGAYYFEVKPFPHHILRENKVLTGAGADRMQTGMQQSFGVTIGRAAIVKANHPIFFIAVANEKARNLALKALERIKSKLPCRTRMAIERLD